VLQKKPGVLNFVTLAYGNSKGQAIIQDFAGHFSLVFSLVYFLQYSAFTTFVSIVYHWAIKNKQMANVWTFDLESQSLMKFSYDSDIESIWITSGRISSKKMKNNHFYF
jgi:hypothetical protein